MEAAPRPGRQLGLATASWPSAAALGAEMHALLRELFPICRSITGAGVRETFAVLGRELELSVTEVPSGTAVYDWRIPPEWNVRDAYVADRSGARVIDFRTSNLHLVGYSVPFRGRVSRAELDAHLHSLPEHPDWIPYRTSYYAPTWGFCLSERQRSSLTDDRYDVVVDTSLADGSLTYAEAVVAGARSTEIVVSSNSCHPSLANDALSGVVVAATLARLLRGRALQHTYRFLFAPGTIGPLAWLQANEQRLDRIAGGLGATCLGDPGPFTYKRSRRGASGVDRAVAIALRDSGRPHEIEDFVPWGGDERQFCSPGFDLPFGVLSRTPYGRYPEYHTSADDLELVTPEALADSALAYLEVFDLLESDRVPLSLSPRGEPQLGRRGLYRQLATGVPGEHEARERARLWVLNLADGRHSLVDMAERSQLPFAVLRDAAAELEAAGLLAATDGAEER